VKRRMAKVESVRLQDVAEINAPAPQEVLADGMMVVSFVPMGAVSELTASVVAPEERVVAACRKGFTAFARGDVLVAKITPCFENGKIVLADIPHRFGFGSTEFHVVRPVSSKLDPRYLLHALRHPEFRLKGERRMTGSAGQRRVPASFLSTFAIPLPTLDEQRRSAEILDKADALRAKRRAALALLDTLTQSIFLDMFGDPATNPKGWPVQSLRECTAQIQIGPFGSLLHQEDYVEGGIPLINPKHIQQGAICPDASETVSTRKFAELTNYHLRAGDVVMGRRGEMGRCAIVREDSGPLLCGTGSLFIRPDSDHTTSLFLLFLLSSAALKARLERLSLGQTLPNLNSQIVEGLQVPLPPVAVQHEFAARVEAARWLINAQTEAAGELDLLFASLQHRAFRGEL
jgi:type I restriction enzyme S subunit